MGQQCVSSIIVEKSHTIRSNGKSGSGSSGSGGSSNNGSTKNNGHISDNGGSVVIVTVVVQWNTTMTYYNPLLWLHLHFLGFLLHPLHPPLIHFEHHHLHL